MSIDHVNIDRISDLFDRRNNTVFEIPKYQREYIWGKKQWEKIFDDLDENQVGYFLGSMICINSSNDSIKAPKLSVIDGQQRLTTISLLLCALYSSMTPYKDEIKINEDQNLEFSLLKKKLVIDSNNIRVIPQTQNYNLDDYKWVLSEQGLIPTSSPTMPKNAGNRRIKKAFEYFRNRISNLMVKKKTKVAATLFELLKKVNESVVVMIEVLNHSEAYMLFSSLNSRGTPLTAVELIKNILLKKLDSVDGSKSIDSYYDRWQAILGNIGEEGGAQERFFRHHYNAFRRELNKPFIRSQDNARQYPLGALATGSNMLDIYEKIINNDPHKFLNELTASSVLYSKFIVPTGDSLSKSLRDSYQSLSHVKGTPSYLLLLYLEKKKDQLGINYSDIAKIAGLMTKFFVRRNLTDKPPTRDVTRMLMAIIDGIEKKKGALVLDAIKEELEKNLCSDSEFEAKLRGPIYEDNVDVARFILCEYASEKTREAVDLWKRDNKDYVWTIEHIFPQDADIKKPWVDMIAGGDKQKAKEIQARCVHTLGNLTLTGYNSSLSNKPFLEKREMKDSNGKFIGYRNGLNLNEDVAFEKCWTEDKIEKRTDKLVKKILTMFKI